MIHNINISGKAPEAPFCEPILFTELEDIYLSQENEKIKDNLLREQMNMALLKKHFLPITKRLMLEGEPGTGKTLLVKHLAIGLEATPYRVETSSMISSYVGGTAQNLKKTFDHFNNVKNKIVLFIDEIDTIAMRRVEDAERSDIEHNRNVNQLLLSLEEMPGNILLVGATNLFESLDPAVLRRFDLKMTMGLPNDEQKEKFLQELIHFHRVTISSKQANSVMEMPSFAHMKKMYHTLAKEILFKL